jgi:predicted  nucleic acid-binding Zn-ribbon protein
MTEKTPDHLAAEVALADADTRLAKARTNHAGANAAFGTAKAARDALMASSTAGDGVTADQVRDIEDALRNTESRLDFTKAALGSAEAARKKAVADLRPILQVWYRSRHAELMAQRVVLANEADALLAAARAKLVEVDAMRDAFHALKAEADASPAAPLVAGLGLHFLPVPGHQAAGIRIAISTPQMAGTEWSHSSFSAALGHGAPTLPPAA